MVNLITKHADAIQALCRRYHVATLEVFGSAVDGSFDPDRSDLDFLVEFGDLPEGRRFDTYFALLHDLENLFGRHVDLVESGAMRNPYLIRRVNESRRLIYAA